MSQFKIKKIIYISIIIVFTALEVSKAGNPKKPLLTWKKIKGVQYYLIEITNKKGKLIRKETVSKTKYYAKLKEGNYKVCITGYDKSGKQYGKSKWSNLIIKKALRPEVNKIIIPELTAKIKNAVIIIRGSNFSKKIKIFLKKKSKTVPVKNVWILSHEKIKFNIYPEKLGAGKYDVILINPGGKKSTTNDAITIEKEQKDLSNIKKRTGLLHANGLYLGMGYQYGIILPDWDKVVDHSFLGVNMILWYDLGGFSRISNIKILKNFGFGFKGNYLFYTARGKTDISNSKLEVGSAFAGMHYKENFSLPVFFIFKIFCGATFTKLRKEETNKIKKISSTDISISAEFSVLYKFKKNYFFEIGVDYLNSFFTEKEFRSLSPFFRIGFIF